MSELRWGHAADRGAMGLALIAAGAVAIAGSSVYVLWLAGLGTLASVAGWAILPADGWRRVTAAAIATPMAWLLVTGPHFLGVLVVVYLAWMLARHRPPRAWLTVVFPAAAAGVAAAVFPDIDRMLPALGLMALVLTGSAWLAALLSRPGRSGGGLPARAQPARSADS